MVSHIQDKVAFITGAGQGVGQGIALALAKAGAKVALFGRTESKLVDTRKLIEQVGSEAVVLAGDVCSAEDLNRAVSATVEAWGGVDILVNNAQQVPQGKLADVTDEAFIAGFESGPLAALRLMKLCHPLMAQRGGGVTFNLVSSAGVRWDMTGYGAYAAVKQAMRALTRGASAEWGADNIRALSLAPHALSKGMQGWIDKNPEEAAQFLKTIPLGRLGECEGDIGEAVVALCSPQMRYLTGATIPLDGGQANFD